MATRFQHRRGTSAQWAAANPVLPDGELGYEKDTGIVKIGNGTSTWNQLSPILNGQYLLAGGKAYDSDRLDGLDSTAFAQKNYVDDRILAAGTSRVLVTHFGSGTSFPTTGVRIGDRFERTDLFCEFYFNGAAWRQTRPAQGTNAQRLAIVTTNPALYAGFQFQETDGVLWEWQTVSGVGWTRPWNSVWGRIGIQTDPATGAGHMGTGLISNSYRSYFDTPNVPLFKNRKYRMNIDAMVYCGDVSLRWAINGNLQYNLADGSQAQASLLRGYLGGSQGTNDFVYLTYAWNFTPTTNIASSLCRWIGYTTYTGGSARYFETNMGPALWVDDLGPVGPPIA